MSATRDVALLVDRIRPILAGHPPEIQGAAMADLLGIWLAGHIIHGDPAETSALRARLLATHIELVADLIPINEAEIHGQSK